MKLKNDHDKPITAIERMNTQLDSPPGVKSAEYKSDKNRSRYESFKKVRKSLSLKIKKDIN